MKYTIMGFSQPTVIELNKTAKHKITIEDLAILRWIVDFTPKMSKHIECEEVYYWLEYDYFLKDMPIVDIKKDSLYRRLSNLVDSGILTHKTIRKNGTYSYYGFGEKYKELISDHTEKNPEGYGKKSVGGTEKNPEQNNPSTINPSTKKYNIEVFQFEEFWNLYPNKTAKSKCEEKWNKLKDEEKVKIKETIESFIKFKPFESYNHPNPLTYLNQKRWEDEINVETSFISETDLEKEMMEKYTEFQIKEVKNYLNSGYGLPKWFDEKYYELVKQW